MTGGAPVTGDARAPRYDVVIPTSGRPCLAGCLAALAAAKGPLPRQVILVDDRPGRTGNPLPLDAAAGLPIQVIGSGGRGPAAARNAGWLAAGAPWTVFIDDDVLVGPGWRAQVAVDLTGLPDRVGGIQGRIRVPGPAGRRPTDWERSTQALAAARWITADMAYRRAALADCCGFDERFPRAFREDADLALRVVSDGWELRTGHRETCHPVRPSSLWGSARAQAGNADDALMRLLHGPGWHERAGASRGRRGRHLLITLAELAAAGLAAVSAGRGAGLRRSAGALACLALAGHAELAAARIIPGPRTPREINAMTLTSMVIPELASWHWLRGWLAAPRARPWPPQPRAVLFDRDGTLVRDLPYSGNPALVELIPGARAAVSLARLRGLRIGMITNQSGVARGLLAEADVAQVNARVVELLGPLDTIQACLHAPEDGCGCRKPAAGMVRAAAAQLGVRPHECAVIGDIGADVEAARAAGARGILVPAPATQAADQAGVRVAANLVHAVGMLTGDTPVAAIWANGSRRS